MKLLIEECPDFKTLIEDVGGQKKMYIEGVFTQSEVVNGNNRIYPEGVMDSAMQDYIRNYVNRNRAYGELGHPDGPKINEERISHRIVSLQKNGKNYWGKAVVLNTPLGMIAKRIMEDGGMLGVSSRALGDLKMINGVNVVQPNFKIATAADIVINPSAPDAFVQSVMENKEWVLTEGGWTEVDFAKARKTISEATRADYEHKALGVFKDFLSKIGKN